jgi:outer membrane lipoprotein SlyB
MKQLLTTTAMAVMISLSLYGLFSFKAKSNETTAYEYRQFSTVESVVSGGMGRSRMVSTDAKGQHGRKRPAQLLQHGGYQFWQRSKQR